MFFRRKAPTNPCVKRDDENTYRVRIRTARHGDMVEFRFTKSAHISVADEGGYIFRKGFVSDAHFDRGEVTVTFDARYNVKDIHVDGGEAIPVADWT